MSQEPHRAEMNWSSRGSGWGPRQREPVFNLPAVVTWLLVVMWLVQIARDTVMTRSQNIWLLVEGGFIPWRYTEQGLEQGAAWIWTPVTYSLLHGGYTHLIVNSIWLMAFGAIVARRIGVERFLIFWVLSAVASAALYWFFNPGSQVPVIGASGVVSALMGAAARFAFPHDGRFRRMDAHLLPRNSVTGALTNRTVLIYVAVWFGVNALAAVGFAAGAGQGAQIAWEAHIGGFLFGFFAFAWFDPLRGY